MMWQKKKRWLEKAWELKAEIEFCDMIIQDLSIYSSPAFGERVTTSKGNGEEKKIAAKLAEKDKAERDRAKAQAELEKRKLAINNLKDGNQKKVLWLRYIEHYKWEDIFYSVSYGKTRCHEIHKAGVAGIRIA